MTNGIPIGVPEVVVAAFLDLVEAGSVQADWFQLYGPVFAALYENPSRLAGKHRPTNPAPARPESFYLGTYANRYYGPATVRRGASGLRLLLGPKPLGFALRHWNGDTFSYRPPQPGDDISAVTFTPGPGSTAANLTVENLDETGLGRFRRERA